MAKGAYIGIPRFEPVFADNAWSQIIEACQRNMIPDAWAVGDQKVMTINGTDYLIDIIGKNHDVYSDGGGIAPLTFGMHDCYGTTYGMGVGTNNGGYGNTPMHKETLPSIKSLMPPEVQAAIAPVDKKSSAGNKSAEIETISCDLFLLSEIEVRGSLTHAAAGEGSQYDYFKNGGSKVKNVDGGAAMWRLRSPAIASTYSYCTVNTDGKPNYVTASNVLGLVFGFCFGGTSELNKNSVARKAKKGYIGVPYTTIKPVFADNTWEQIVYACKNNEVPDTWQIGDQKAMTIGDRDYLIDIIGKHHDTYADGSGTAPLTFQMHDCYRTTYVMNPAYTSFCDWESSVMRTTHLPAILALMPAEVQSGIREVNKLTSAGNKSTDMKTTADKLFLLSEDEIFGAVSWAVSGEGSQYEYYVAGNSRIKYFNGKAAAWWERSPCYQYPTYFCNVLDNGNYDRSGPTYSFGVAFAFCFGGNPIPTTARKIKKAYIGDESGVARLCYPPNDRFVPAGSSRFVTADNKTFCVR